MPTDSEQQLVRFADALDREAPTISVDEILSRGTVDVGVDVLEQPSRDQVSRFATVSPVDGTPRGDGNGAQPASMVLAPMVATRRARPVVALKVAFGAAAAAVLVVALAVVVGNRDDSNPADVTPVPVDSAPPSTAAVLPPDTDLPRTTTTASAQESPFVGGWQSTDTDGSSQTMYVAQWGPNEYDVAVTDEDAACPGGAQTRGIGRRATDTSLVVARPESYCWDADGFSPPSPFDPAPFTLDLSAATDTLVDSAGVVWRKQAVPPLDADDTALVGAFLGARLAGEGAEQYLLTGTSDRGPRVPPLLYATSGGAAYERFEFEPATDPAQPDFPKVVVRLFAEDGTVVQQRLFFGQLRDGQRGIQYFGRALPDLPTTEDSKSVPVQFSILDGEVTLFAAPPWEAGCCPSPEGDGNFDRLGILRKPGLGYAHFVFAAEPLGVGIACEGPPPANAEALARRIMDDPDSETSEPVPVRIGGVDGFQIDVEDSAQFPGLCARENDLVSGLDVGGRRRLFMVDSPVESAEILTFAYVANPEYWDDAVADIAPILDSVQFQLD